MGKLDRRLARAAAMASLEQARQRTAEFKRLRGEPDLGFETTPFDEAGIEALNRSFESAQSDLEERFQQQQAASGFGVQRGGPFASMTGRETQRLLGQRAGVESEQRFRKNEQTAANLQAWKAFVLGGRGDFSPVINNPLAQASKGKNQFMQLLGSAVGNIGVAAGGSFGSSMGRQAATGLVGGRGGATGGSTFGLGSQGFPFGSSQDQFGRSFVRAPFS